MPDLYHIVITVLNPTDNINGILNVSCIRLLSAMLDISLADAKEVAQEHDLWNRRIGSCDLEAYVDAAGLGRIYALVHATQTSDATRYVITSCEQIYRPIIFAPSKKGAS